MDMFEVNENEIKLVGPILQKIMWSNRATKQRIQEYGVNVTPVTFYSDTPSIADINASFEYVSHEPPYLESCPFDEGILNQTLRELASYANEFDPLVQGDEERTDRFFWNNSQFSFSDAVAYYSFIRHLKPTSVVEIGNGFSTLVAIEAIKKNDFGSVICIEPFPRPFLDNNKNIELKKVRAQDIDPDNLNNTLKDGDILFIDSTHTVKTGSDCLHIYLRLLPKIRKNIYVHVHDIFLPFGLPIDWLLDRQIFWTEQYLLLALLTDNPKTRVLYGGAYHYNFNRGALEELMNNRYPAGGASFWFEYRGRLDPRS